MSKLLKEAIADAKAIRATALANAQMALQEAFTPKLQSMLSKQIQSEVEGEEDEIPMDAEIPVEEPEIPMNAEIPAEVPVAEPEIPMNAEIPAEVPVAEPEIPMDAEIPAEVPIEEPVVDEVPVEDPEVQENELGLEDEPTGMGIEDEFGEDEFDIESIIRELESESNLETEVEEPTFEENTEFDPVTGEEPDSVDGLDTESKAVAVAKGAPAVAVGQGEPKVNDTTDAITQGPVSDPTDLSKATNSKDNTDTNFSENTELDLEAILREIEDEEKEIEDEDEKEEENEALKSENENLKSDLDEHIKVVKFLKSKLEEVNLLNAKLLYTSKLFKSNNMDNDQKMKVIENFDRAKTLREVKLIFATISESYSTKKVSASVKKITEGASKVTGQKPVKKVIKEEVKKTETKYIIDSESSNRLKKLAGIK